MEKLSVVIISYNEEKNIKRCLLSVKDIADEIIVVDSFSTDKTEEICKKFNVKFVKKEFLGYSKQKNFANSLTENKYILSIDADEELSIELQKSILEIKTHFKYDAYYLKRCTNYCGTWLKHGAWYPDKRIRLWNKEIGFWEGDIHENIILNKNSSTFNLKNDILHYSYNSIESHIAQLNKFTTISAEEMAKNGKKASYVKVFLSPFFNFLKGFFVKVSFLDGYYGVVVTIINSFATFLKYVKLRKLNTEINNEQKV